MAEPGGKVAQLTPEEWKQLVLLNMAQLQSYLQTVPGNTETGTSGLTDQHLALIDQHLARGRAFVRAWALARVEMAPVNVAQPEARPNGAQEPKRKGGWPKGKSRARPKAPMPEAGRQ